MPNERLKRGLWPVMLTPFLENDEVDYEGLKLLTEFYIRSGVNGLFANCQSSEMFQLTNEERLKIIRTVVAVAGAEIPVVATGTFTHDVRRCGEFIRQVYDQGVEAVILLTNQFADAEEDEETFKRTVENLMNLTDNVPLGLYECPQPYKRLLSPQTLRWLANTGRFYFHKDTSCDPIAIKNKIDATKDSNLFFYNANTATILTSLTLGARGMTPIAANFYPELYSYFFGEFEKTGITPQLTAFSDRLTVMGAVVDLCYPFSAKHFLKMRGLPVSDRCRVSYTNPKRENFLNLKSLMSMFHETAERFGVEVANN